MCARREHHPVGGGVRENRVSGLRLRQRDPIREPAFRLGPGDAFGEMSLERGDESSTFVSIDPGEALEVCIVMAASTENEDRRLARKAPARRRKKTARRRR